MELKYQITTPPTWWPLSLEQAKAHLRISHTSEDEVIWSMLRAATEMVEREAWVQLNQKVITIYRDSWAALSIVSLSPVQAVVSVKYYDADDALQTMEAAGFKADLVGEPARIEFEETPDLSTRFNPVEIAVRVGYEEDCKIPAGLANCVLMVLGDLFENRQNMSPTAIHELPSPTRQMIGLYSKKAFV